jgi:hypothetical protein
MAIKNMRTSPRTMAAIVVTLLAMRLLPRDIRDMISGVGTIIFVATIGMAIIYHFMKKKAPFPHLSEDVGDLA